MSLRRLKFNYAIVAGFSVLVVALGIASIVYYFTNVYNVSNSHSVFGSRYLLADVLCIFGGSRLLWHIIPAFIPLKKRFLHSSRTCPYCGEVVDEDATCCKKYQRELD